MPGWRGTAPSEKETSNGRGKRTREGGFSLLEVILVVMLVGIISAVVVLRFPTIPKAGAATRRLVSDMREDAVIANAQATLDSGRAAILLEFADDVLKTGSYTSPITINSTAGQKFNSTDVTSLENLMQGTSNFPTAYDSGPNQGFRWWLVSQGSTAATSSPLAPVITAVIDVTCTASQSITRVTTNDDCHVSKL